MTQAFFSAKQRPAGSMSWKKSLPGPVITVRAAVLVKSSNGQKHVLGRANGRVQSVADIT
jgi:hypothetical protein